MNCVPWKIIFHKQEGNIFCIIKLGGFTINKFSLTEFAKGVFQVEGRELQKNIRAIGRMAQEQNRKYTTKPAQYKSMKQECLIRAVHNKQDRAKRLDKNCM